MICVGKQNFKAPNGNQSQLYSSLYDNFGHDVAMKAYLQVRTDEFKQWFGDWENDPDNASQAVDENGEPLVLYHGTAERYNKEKDMPAFYATPNINYARRYGKSSAERLGLDESAMRVSPLFLNTRNPQRFDSNEVEYDTIANLTQDDVNKWETLGKDGLHYIEQEAMTSDGVYEEYAVFNSDNIDLVDDMSETHNQSTVSEQATTETKNTVRVEPRAKRFFDVKSVEDYLKAQDGIASKKFNDKIYVKADSHGTSNYGKVVKMVNRINEENPGLLKVTKQYDESRKAGRDVHTVSISKQAIKRNLDEFRQLREEANEHIIPVEDYEQRMIRPINYTLNLTRALREVMPNRKTIRLPSKDKPYIEANLRKLLRSKGVNDFQINTLFEYMRQKDLQEVPTEDLIISLEADLAYGVETRLGTEEKITEDIDIDSVLMGTEEERVRATKENRKAVTQIPSQKYKDYSVPGGANYKEIGIRTPSIRPVIESHAEFTTSESIGWFRADEVLGYSKVDTGIETLSVPDENKSTTTRRILEFQSDLFQKSRNKSILEEQPNIEINVEAAAPFTYEGITYSLLGDYDYNSLGMYFKLLPEYSQPLLDPSTIDDLIEDLQDNKISSVYFEQQTGLTPTDPPMWIGEKEDGTPMSVSKEEVEKIYRKYSDVGEQTTGNKFLQFLNQENNWVRFFVQSIIQDSANEGYTKVRFPRENATREIERFESTNVESQLNKANKKIAKLEKQLKEAGGPLTKLERQEFEEAIDIETPSIDSRTKRDKLRNIKERLDIENELNPQKRARNSLKNTVKKIKSITDFYEVTIKNVLDKLYGEQNIKSVKDENGYGWYEYTLKEKDSTNTIYLHQEKLDDRLTPENRADFEAKKRIMLNTFPMVEEIIEDYEMTAKGRIEQNGRVIRVNPNKFTTDTLGHEFGHLLIDLIGGLENPLVQNALEELRGSALEKRVRDLYSDLIGVDEATLDKELLAQAIGEETANIFEQESKMNRWERILTRIFNKIKQVLHIEKSDVKRLARMVVQNKPLETDGASVILGEYEQRYDNISEEEKNQLKKMMTDQGRVDETLTKLEELRNKAIDNLNKKIAIYDSRGNKEQVNKLQEELNHMQNTEPLEGLARFASVASRQTQHVYDRYMKLKEKIDSGETSFKELAELFRQWYDYLSAYDTLGDVRNEFVKAYGVDTVKKQFPRMYEMLNNVISLKDTLKSLYRDESYTILANMMVKYDTRVYAEFKLAREKEWRKWTKKEQKEKPLDQYINEQIEQNREQILQDTRLSLKNEAVKAKADISWASRWLDSLLDSDDEIVAAAAKAFTMAHDKSRYEHIGVRDRIVDIVRRLEKKQGYNTLSSPEKLYDFMLEKSKEFIVKEETVLDTDRVVYIKKGKNGKYRKAQSIGIEDGLNVVQFLDDQSRAVLSPGQYYFKSHVGKYTQHIVDEYHSEFNTQFQSYKYMVYNMEFPNMNEEAAKNERRKLISKWKNNNTNFDKNGFNEAKYEYMQELVKEGVMTQSEINKIKDNEQKAPASRVTLEYLLTQNPQEEDNNLEAYYRIREWLKSNEWNYRVPSEEWANEDFYKLEEMRKKGLKKGKQTDPRIEFYDYIYETNREVDSHLPYKYRIGTKLPSVSKTLMERFRSGYNIGKAVSKDFRKGFTRRPEDVEKGMTVGEGAFKAEERKEGEYIVRDTQSGEVHSTGYETFDEAKRMANKLSENEKNRTLKLQDENGNEKMFLPIFYSSDIAEEEQSYDLGSIYNTRFRMGIDYKYKNEILPELELTQFVLNNRHVTETANGNPIKNALRKLRNKDSIKGGSDTYIAKQYEDWMKSAVYGKGVDDLGEMNVFGLKMDTTKFVQQMNKYTALTMLGVNFVAGSANILLGEITQRAEALAKEFYTPKDYFKAGMIYTANYPGIFRDIGSRSPKNKLSKLEEFYDLLHDYGNDPRMRKHTVFRQLMRQNTVFFTSHAGEHKMQVRAMIAMLLNQKIKDKKGNTMKRPNGKPMTLYHALVIDENTGQIVLDKDVEKNSNWTIEDALQYGNRMKGVLAKLHGEYSKIGANAFQRKAIGQMALMFRKFVVPGFKRRFEMSRKKDKFGNRQFKYNERTESFSEGMYITTFRTLGESIKYMIKDLRRLQFEMSSNYWKGLTSTERANIKRSLGEFIALGTAIVIGYAALKNVDEADDEREEWMWEFIAFQALRLRSELMFFYNPIESMRLLRSPAASFSIIENIIKLFNLVFNPFDEENPFEELESGPMKGKTKIAKQIRDLIPFWKQYYRISDMDSMLGWFQK